MDSQTTQVNAQVKVTIDGEIRRFEVTELTYIALTKLIRSRFSLSDDLLLKLTYLDEENDYVSLSIDEDLVYATENFPLIKIFGTTQKPDPCKGDESAVNIQKGKKQPEDRIDFRLHKIQSILDEGSVTPKRRAVLEKRLETLKLKKETQKPSGNFKGGRRGRFGKRCSRGNKGQVVPLTEKKLEMINTRIARIEGRLSNGKVPPTRIEVVTERLNALKMKRDGQLTVSTPSPRKRMPKNRGANPMKVGKGFGRRGPPPFVIRKILKSLLENDPRFIQALSN